MRGFSSQERTEIVEVHRATVTEDAAGQEIAIFGLHLRAYASVRYGSGEERRAAAQEAGSQTATFGLAYSNAIAGVTVKDRFVYGGNWDITSVVVEPRNAGVVITAIKAV